MNPLYLTYNKELKIKVDSFINEWENDLDFFITKTSGSTGIPKEISIKKEFARHSAMNTCTALGLTSNSKSLLCLDISTIGGKMMVVRSIVQNMQLIVADVTSNPLKDVNEDIDFIAIAPIQLAKILEKCPDKLRAINHVIVGGGIISSLIEQQLISEKITVYQTFGMTETISHIALRKVGFNGSDFYEVLPGIQMSTIENQLIIAAPNLGINQLTTNDLVELISPTHFKWLGRSDFVINSGGIKIIPEQIERNLTLIIPQPFFIIGKEDALLGEKIVIIIEGKQIDTYLNKSFYHTLEKFHIPKEISFIEKFMRTASNKINRLETLKTINAAKFRQIL